MPTPEQIADRIEWVTTNGFFLKNGIEWYHYEEPLMVSNKFLHEAEQEDWDNMAENFETYLNKQ